MLCALSPISLSIIYKNHVGLQPEGISKHLATSVPLVYFSKVGPNERSKEEELEKRGNLSFEEKKQT